MDAKTHLSGSAWIVEMCTITHKAKCTMTQHELLTRISNTQDGQLTQRNGCSCVGFPAHDRDRAAAAQWLSLDPASLREYSYKIKEIVALAA